MPIKTTIEPDKPSDNPLRVHSLWQEPDTKDVYVFIEQGEKYITMNVSDFEDFWTTSIEPRHAIKGLVPFHGKVTIELGDE